MQKITIKLHSTTNTGSIEGNFDTVKEAKNFIDEFAKAEEIRQIIEDGMNDIFAKLCDSGYDVKDQFPNELCAIQETESDLTQLVLDMLKFRNESKD